MPNSTIAVSSWRRRRNRGLSASSVGALVVAPGFLAVAARLHVAPAAAAVAAVVEKEPLAIGGPAFANGGASVRGEKFGSRLRDRPQYAIEKIASVGLPFPAILAVPSRQFAALQRHQRKVVDPLDVCGTGIPACSDGGESAIEAFAQNDGFAEGASRSGRVAARAGAEAGGQFWGAGVWLDPRKPADRHGCQGVRRGVAEGGGGLRCWRNQGKALRRLDRTDIWTVACRY